MTERELLELKEEIFEAKPKVSELKGEKQALMKRLKEEWGCSSLEDVEKKIDEKTKQFEEISSKIQLGLEELEEKLNMQ